LRVQNPAEQFGGQWPFIIQYTKTQKQFPTTAKQAVVTMKIGTITPKLSTPTATETTQIVAI